MRQKWMKACGLFVFVAVCIMAWVVAAADLGLVSADSVKNVSHPADLDEDYSIVMSEAIAYLAGWQQGTNPMNYAIRAAYLWQNGERYTYNAGEEPPLCWELPPSVGGEMVTVPAGTFQMGRTNAGDDAVYGSDTELPVHSVYLDEYSIGKYEVTSGEYCEVLNWALAQGHLKDQLGALWPGEGKVYAGDYLYIIVDITRAECTIQFKDGAFEPKNRAGLPEGTVYSLATHPMLAVSWYGAAAYCNWLSEMAGLVPPYDLTQQYWPFQTSEEANGYRLPTEAEWERAAAWDGSKHWIYGFTGDMMSGNGQCNYNENNPLGLGGRALTSPVGWFDGMNISPNGEIQTVESPSPVGAFDMSGNVWEWCQDWYGAYSEDAQTNPAGPSSGTERVTRGGSFENTSDDCRAAKRDMREPDKTPYMCGFRPVLSAAAVEGEEEGETPVEGELEGEVPVEGELEGEFPPEGEVPAEGEGETPVEGELEGEGEVEGEFDIPEMVSMPAGSFDMGRPYAWSVIWPSEGEPEPTDELPLHWVYVDGYSIGKYEITNQQYCDVLTWALDQGYLRDFAGDLWAGTGSIYATLGEPYILVNMDRVECNIQYIDGAFYPKSRTGLPGITSYSMGTHPMVTVSWYGAAAYCNWLSEIEGVTPCYDMTTENWDLVTVPPTSGGYRLPTEAEWERAAAWDGVKHWIYGCSSDALDATRCNFYLDALVNPLGLAVKPFTSPAGWFDGVNISPNGDVQTVDGASPSGVYDLSGNVWEWCQDWYDAYPPDAQTNPTGPALGTERVLRGGSFEDLFDVCRAAKRDKRGPDKTPYMRGFRIARTP